MPDKQDSGDAEVDRLIQVANVFMVPSSILGAGFAAAKTEELKAALSIIGVFVALVWLIAGVRRAWHASDVFLTYAVAWVLPCVAVVFWIASVVVHTGVWAWLTTSEQVV